MTTETKPERGPCEALIMPLRESRLRPCGKAGHRRINGRVLCPRHEARRKAAAAQHGEGA